MRSLRIVTFNIHRGVGSDGVLDLERIAAALTGYEPDVIALQELDRNLPRTGGVDQPGLLAERLGLAIEFRPTITRAGGAYGIALLAPELGEVEWVELPRRAGEEPRGAIVARVSGLWVCATHLSTDRAARRIQIGALGRLVSELQGPAAVAGDLNASRRELRPLARLGLTPGPRLQTYRGRMRRQPDHILAGPGVTLERAWTVATAASDHLPLVADVRF